MKRPLVSMFGVALAGALAACGQSSGEAKKESGSSTPAAKSTGAPSAKPSGGAPESGVPRSGNTQGKEGKPSESQPAVASGAASAAPPPSAKAETPSSGENPAGSTSLPSYSFDKIKKIDDSCASPWVMLATAPESVGADYEWKYTKQALAANPEFHVTTSAPAQQWQVQFELHQLDASMSSAYALVAKCHDGLTCNNLAAMYKAAVKSATPQVGCGATPSSFGAQVKIVDLLPGGPASNMPDEVIGKCARLGACSARQNPSDTKDVAIECQKAPSSFDLGCAMKPTCGEVASCLGK
ncbi:MAG: hypothetical protein U0414_07800 [Polyangiaceae bacterium]